MNEQNKNYLFLVEKSDAEQISTRLTSVPCPDLNDGDVRIRVSHSSLNYKDGMAATGHPGIVKTFPHVPGIDSVGTIDESKDQRFQVGDHVIATGHEWGVERWGGWATFVQGPADWVVPLPSGLAPVDVMTIGTAGFTSAQCVQALIKHGVTPESGPVIVSGATGGVGCIAVMLLAQLGYEVVAVTGKQDKHDWLKNLGAAEVVGRDALESDPKRPLMKGQYAAGVDTVGGDVLATMLKQLQHRGCIACCGVAGGAELATTVYPFILRGVALYGIDSAWCPDDIRGAIWQKFATDWKLPNLDQIRVDLTLTTVTSAVEQILAGKFFGRGVIQIAE